MWKKIFASTLFTAMTVSSLAFGFQTTKDSIDTTKDKIAEADSIAKLKKLYKSDIRDLVRDANNVIGDQPDAKTYANAWSIRMATQRMEGYPEDLQMDDLRLAMTEYLKKIVEIATNDADKKDLSIEEHGPVVAKAIDTIGEPEIVNILDIVMPMDLANALNKMTFRKSQHKDEVTGRGMIWFAELKDAPYEPEDLEKAKNFMLYHNNHKALFSPKMALLIWSYSDFAKAYAEYLEIIPASWITL